MGLRFEAITLSVKICRPCAQIERAIFDGSLPYRIRRLMSATHRVVYLRCVRVPLVADFATLLYIILRMNYAFGALGN